MAARRSRSKKRSDANSPARSQLEELTFYLDKCLGRNVVSSALRKAGATVELHTDHFPENAEDSLWLPQVGDRGWVILTKDSKLLTNQLEIIALLRSGSATFALRAADMSGPEMSKAFVAALPDMLKFLNKFDPPFLATVSRSGNVSILATFGDLIKKVD